MVNEDDIKFISEKYDSEGGVILSYEVSKEIYNQILDMYGPEYEKEINNQLRKAIEDGSFEEWCIQEEARMNNEEYDQLGDLFDDVK